MYNWYVILKRYNWHYIWLNFTDACIYQYAEFAFTSISCLVLFMFIVYIIVLLCRYANVFYIVMHVTVSFICLGNCLLVQLLLWHSVGSTHGNFLMSQKFHKYQFKIFWNARHTLYLIREWLNKNNILFFIGIWNIVSMILLDYWFW